MKKTIVCMLLLTFCGQSIKAAISLRVCETDDLTVFDGREIMVGQKLTIIISSDCNEYWSGGLFVADDDRALGYLTGRDSDPNIRDWTDSHYANAGDFATVMGWKDSEIWGFDMYGSAMYGSDSNTVAGDWFVIDYEAIEAGEPNLIFYDYNNSWDEPNSIMTFSQVPTRDFDDNDIVNLADYTMLTNYWLVDDCSEPNWCEKTDINTDGSVDINDLTLFTEYWLWYGVPQTQGGEDPNQGGNPNEPEDPNVIYSIVDVSGLSEITIDANESITLYVDMTTTEYNNVNTFNIEVIISDPNLGSIDNTEHPSGTAQILAGGRYSFVDHWGPGLGQEEGIQLSAASWGDALDDGHLASFIFTCEDPGDVTLELINRASFNTNEENVYPVLESILIHQVDPNSP